VKTGRPGQAILLESQYQKNSHRWCTLVQKAGEAVVRGKSKGAVEFGAKIRHHCGEWLFHFFIASLRMHYTKVETLIAQAENY